MKLLKGKGVIVPRPTNKEFHVVLLEKGEAVANEAQEVRPDVLIIFQDGTKDDKPSYALGSFCR